MQFRLITTESDAVPGVVTIALPGDQNSSDFGQKLQKAGYLLSYNSDYLRRRNWIQICLMGECLHEKVVPVANALNRVCSHRAASPAAQPVAG